MEQTGKVMVFGGLVLAGLGAIVWMVARAFPGFRPGRLPGDIVVERPGMSVYFPIATMIILSVVLSLVMWLISLVRK